MSLILDALNKADNEENKTDVPSYASDHDFGPESELPSNGNRRFYIILVICAILATAFTLVLVNIIDNEKSSATAESANTSDASPATNNQQTANKQPATNKQQATNNPKNIHSKNNTRASTPASAQEKSNTHAVNVDSKKNENQANQNIANTSPTTPPINKPTKLKEIKAPTLKPAKTEAELRRAAIAEQYKNIQKSNKAEHPTQQTASNKNSDAISAIYQKAETQEQDDAPQVQQVSLSNKSEVINTNEENTKPKQKPKVQDVKPAEPKLENVLAKYPNLNFIHDLPFATQSQIPTVMYTEHNYNNRAASVTLNKQSRRKGEKIATGLVLDEILEDGIVLKFNTVRFKMKALNSWVNM